MNKITITICASLFSIASFAQSDNPKFDTKLATKLGADDYGMKKYILVILKSGGNTTTDQAVIDSAFRGHLANIKRLADMGKLVVAGPLGENDKNYRGIFILDVKTKEEANELLVTDPAIKAHLLDPEVYPWYGSAALGEYLPVHDKISKKKM